MKVMLVQPNTRMDGLIPIGLSVLSAHLKKDGHDVKLYDTTFIDNGEQSGDSYREDAGQIKKVAAGTFDNSRIKLTDRELVADFRRNIKKYNPGLVGVSALEMAYDQGLMLARGIADMDIPVIFGGAYPTSSPRIVMKDLMKYTGKGMVCEGEGELMLSELTTALESGRDIRGIYNLTLGIGKEIYQSGVKVSLEDLATGNDICGEKTGLRRRHIDMGAELLAPDNSIFNPRRFFKKMGGRVVKTAAFELSRGCPYTCTFCCTPMYRQQHKAALKNRVKALGLDMASEKKMDLYHREKPIGKFIDEVKKARDEFGIDFVYFTDESFLAMGTRRFEEFIGAYGKVGLPFFIETRVETVKPGHASALESIGCTGIAMGVESGSPKLRRSLLRRSTPDSTIVRAFNEFEQSRIRVSANNIIGFPGETREDIMKTARLNKLINPDSVVVNTFRPYSGTELRNTCIEMGLVPKEQRAEDNRTHDIVSNGVLSPEELVGLKRAIPLYVSMDESRWDEIRKAEIDDDVYISLMEENATVILDRKARRS